MEKKNASNHPTFDQKVFVVKASQLKTKKSLFAGQAASLCQALSDLTRRKGSKVTGADLRQFLENRRESYFPGSRQSEALRIFQDWRSQLARVGILKAA